MYVGPDVFLEQDNYATDAGHWNNAQAQQHYLHNVVSGQAGNNAIPMKLMVLLFAH